MIVIDPKGNERDTDELARGRSADGKKVTKPHLAIYTDEKGKTHLTEKAKNQGWYVRGEKPRPSEVTGIPVTGKTPE